MKTKTTTFLLLVFTFLFILLLNFSSAEGCEGGTIITECTQIDCNQFRDTFGACLNEPSNYCTDFENPEGDPSCINKEYPCDPVDYQCPGGCDVVSSIDCSTLLKTSCDNQDGCDWTPTPSSPSITCSDNSIGATITTTIGGSSTSVTDLNYCQSNTAYVYTCLDQSISTTTNTCSESEECSGTICVTKTNDQTDNQTDSNTTTNTTDTAIFNCQESSKTTTLTKTLSSITQILDIKENKCSGNDKLITYSCEGEGENTKIKEDLVSCIAGCLNSECQEFSEEFFTEELPTKNSVSYWSTSKDLNTELKEVVVLDSNKIHEKSFFMVTENKENELTFEVVVVKNLAEFSLGEFEGKVSGNKVSYEWNPTALNFINAKEVPSQTYFIFFFKINELRSSVLKVRLESSILPTCFDKEKNGAEESVDCGGNCDLGCDEAEFCRENKIISCSSYTNEGESYCEENPCNLYSSSSSTCYWDTNKCERKIVSESGVCYYREQVEEEDTCEDGYLLYNYDSNFEWNEGYSIEENNESVDYKNCVPISEPVSCSISGEKSESVISEVLANIDIEKYDVKEIAKIAFLVILALLIFYFTFKILRSNKKETPQKRIKDSFVKSEKESEKSKEKKIKGEVKIKTKKEREIEKLLEDFEMDL